MSGTRSNNKAALHHNKTARETRHIIILSDISRYTITYSKENTKSKNQQQEKHELRGAIQTAGRDAGSGGRHSQQK